MLSNITVDDYSPLIQYDGQWLDSFNSSSDPFSSLYQDTSFHSSTTNGSTATLKFKGTAVYIFGAKRGNHGYYSVTVDDQPPEQFDGYAPVQANGTDGVYQYALFVKKGLTDGTHKVTLTNVVNDNRTIVDIDYIVWTREGDLASDDQIVSDADFEYSGSAAMWSVKSNDRFQGNHAHTTDTYGASAALNLDGSEIFIYGGTAPGHGTFKVQVDDGPVVTLNGTSPEIHLKAPLYTTSGLSDGSHRIVITNNEEGKNLDIDYAVVTPHAGSQVSSTNHSMLSSSAIAGIVIGAVTGLALLALTWWYFFYRRKDNNHQASAEHLSGPPATLGLFSSRNNSVVMEPYMDRHTMGLTTEGPGRRKDRAESSIATQSTDVEPRLDVEANSQERLSSPRAHGAGVGILPPMYDQIIRTRAKIFAQSRT